MFLKKNNTEQINKNSGSRFEAGGGERCLLLLRYRARCLDVFFMRSQYESDGYVAESLGIPASFFSVFLPTLGNTFSIQLKHAHSMNKEPRLLKSLHGKVNLIHTCLPESDTMS